MNNLVSRNAREFKRLTQERMIKGLASGRTYAKSKGSGSRRLHKASRRGQRPAVDTGTLVNAIRNAPTGQYRAKVDVADRVNPNSQTLASGYAEILQEKLDRPIMSDFDARQAEMKMKFDAETLIKGLV